MIEFNIAIILIANIKNIHFFFLYKNTRETANKEHNKIIATIKIELNVYPIKMKYSKGIIDTIIKYGFRKKLRILGFTIFIYVISLK